VITVVTGNKNKAAEVAAFFKGIVEVDNATVETIEPQSDSLEVIACSKAEQAYAALQRPLIVDDTGLFISALNGFPGPYAAYVQESIGNPGILRLMKDISARSAYFETVICYTDGVETKTFTGRVEGTIAQNQRGKCGFGYDPIFLAGEKTLAEMEMAEKNSLSHRARALEAFKTWYISRKC